MFPDEYELTYTVEQHERGRLGVLPLAKTLFVLQPATGSIDEQRFIIFVVLLRRQDREPVQDLETFVVCIVLLAGGERIGAVQQTLDEFEHVCDCVFDLEDWFAELICLAGERRHLADSSGVGCWS